MGRSKERRTVGLVARIAARQPALRHDRRSGLVGRGATVVRPSPAGVEFGTPVDLVCRARPGRRGAAGRGTGGVVDHLAGADSTSHRGRRKTDQLVGAGGRGGCRVVASAAPPETRLGRRHGGGGSRPRHPRGLLRLQVGPRRIMAGVSRHDGGLRRCRRHGSRPRFMAGAAHSGDTDELPLAARPVRHRAGRVGAGPGGARHLRRSVQHVLVGGSGAGRRPASELDGRLATQRNLGRRGDAPLRPGRVAVPPRRGSDRQLQHRVDLPASSERADAGHLVARVAGGRTASLRRTAGGTRSFSVAEHSDLPRSGRERGPALQPGTVRPCLPSGRTCLAPWRRPAGGWVGRHSARTPSPSVCTCD